jgi:hypothetical protein
MAGGTIAALSCLDGDNSNLHKVVEHRAKVSTYIMSHGPSIFHKADKLLFQAALLAEYPDEGQVYVDENSEYPGLFFDTSECLGILSAQYRS